MRRERESMSKAGIRVSIPGAVTIKYNLKIEFNFEDYPAPVPHSLEVDATVGFERAEDHQAAENFFVPIILEVSQKAIREHYTEAHRPVVVFTHQLRPGLTGTLDFNGASREDWTRRLEPGIRQSIRMALAMVR